MTTTKREQALAAVERVPEHELRRLLQRMAVTHPFAVVESVERMDGFDAVRGEK